MLEHFQMICKYLAQLKKKYLSNFKTWRLLLRYITSSLNLA